MYTHLMGGVGGRVATVEARKITVYNIGRVPIQSISCVPKRSEIRVLKRGGNLWEGLV